MALLLIWRKTIAPLRCAPTEAGVDIRLAWDKADATLRRMLASGHRALRRGRSSLPNQVYHLTVATADRAPIFADHRAAWAVCRRFEDRRLLVGARMLAWVLMPDHSHWLLQLGESKSLQKTVESLKSSTARDANAALARRGPLWARAYHDRALRCDEDMLAIARYIIANPLRAGLVQRIGDYPSWNATYL